MEYRGGSTISIPILSKITVREGGIQGRIHNIHTNTQQSNCEKGWNTGGGSTISTPTLSKTAVREDGIQGRIHNIRTNTQQNNCKRG
jgi:hypothetical protein